MEGERRGLVVNVEVGLFGKRSASTLGTLLLIVLDGAERNCGLSVPGHGLQLLVPDEVVDELTGYVEDDPRLRRAQIAARPHVATVGMPVDDPLNCEALVGAGGSVPPDGHWAACSALLRHRAGNCGRGGWRMSRAGNVVLLLLLTLSVYLRTIEGGPQWWVAPERNLAGAGVRA